MEETAEKAAEKTSTWLALRNPVFRRLWLAMVVSGSCIGAHNTAVYWAMHKLGASTLHIALMTTVSALPYTLFTLPAGAIADMVDRGRQNAFSTSLKSYAPHEASAGLQFRHAAQDIHRPTLYRAQESRSNPG
jgi:MFS family permease